MGKYADGLPKTKGMQAAGRAAEIRRIVTGVDLASSPDTTAYHVFCDGKFMPSAALNSSEQEEAFKNGERLVMRPRSEDKVPSDRIKELFGNLKGTNDEDVHDRSRDEHDADFGDLGS